MTIAQKFNKQAQQINSLVCVGLDSRFSRLPDRFKTEKNAQFIFNQWIIDQTAPYTSAYKINTAFYESRSQRGWEDLHMTMQYLKTNYPEMVTIADAKRADIGNTNLSYVHGLLDILGFDAITIHPYLGKESVAPFLERKDKATVVLTRTTNPGADEIQMLKVDGKVPLWQAVAQKVADDWNTDNNCMLMMAANHPEAIKKARSIDPEMTFLVPGIGYQGADVEKVMKAGLTKDGLGLIINSSRGVIFAENPAAAAKSLRDMVNKHR